MTILLTLQESKALLTLAKHFLDNDSFTFSDPGGALRIPPHSSDRREKFSLDIPRGQILLERNNFQTRTRAEDIQRLARRFKVSSLVALRRLFDSGFIDAPTLWQNYRKELVRIRRLDRGGSGGGDFYPTLGARIGKRFARAVLSSTLEGQTLFQDACRMLGVCKASTFREAARELGGLP